MKKKDDIFMDRTFDAACLMRANEKEWALEIIKKLVSLYPSDLARINQLFGFYGSLPDSDMFTSRTQYMLEHKDTIKLNYK